MSKVGRPWYRKGTESWYVWHGGRQVFLARGKKNRAGAFARFAVLLGAGPPEPPRPGLGVKELVEAYRNHLRPRIKPTTFNAYQCILGPFESAFGGRLPAEVRSSHLEEWSSGRRWSP